MRFTLVVDGEDLADVTLPAPGEHNVLNALAAIAATRAAGHDPARAALALASFQPAGRRFEPTGEAAGVRVFDDYAHHATEVAATLAAARALGPRRLVAVFQPHLYSRTAHTHDDLGRALAAADVVVVLDVYRARERPEDYPGVGGELVARSAADHAGGREVWWLPTRDEAVGVLAPKLAAGDVVVTLGAGDVDAVAVDLVDRLALLDGGDRMNPGTPLPSTCSATTRWRASRRSAPAAMPGWFARPRKEVELEGLLAWAREEGLDVGVVGSDRTCW